VYAAVAYYPATDRIADEDIASIRVPTLVLAGVRDSFSCCTLRRARALLSVARESAATPPLERVEYADAEHAFNHGRALRPDDAADAMRRTLAHLRRHGPAQ
jgi:dienelactone hydrolase